MPEIPFMEKPSNSNSSSQSMGQLMELVEEVEAQYGLGGKGERLLSTLLGMIFRHRGVGLEAFNEDLKAAINSGRITSTSTNPEIAEYLFGRDSIRETASLTGLPYSKVAPSLGYLIPKIVSGISAQVIDREMLLTSLPFTNLDSLRLGPVLQQSLVPAIRDIRMNRSDTMIERRAPILPWLGFLVALVAAMRFIWPMESNNGLAQNSVPPLANSSSGISSSKAAISKSAVDSRARLIPDSNILKNINGFNLTFQANSAQLSRESATSLADLATFLKQVPLSSPIEIAGHTDSSGDKIFNEQLSKARADTVRSLLIDAGIDEGKLIARGYGDSRPIAPNNTSNGRQKNRRIEFLFAK